MEIVSVFPPQPSDEEVEFAGGDPAGFAEGGHEIVALPVEALVSGVFREIGEPFARGVGCEIRTLATLGGVKLMAIGAVEREVGKQLASLLDRCAVACVDLFLPGKFRLGTDGGDDLFE